MGWKLRFFTEHTLWLGGGGGGILVDERFCRLLAPGMNMKRQAWKICEFVESLEHGFSSVYWYC